MIRAERSDDAAAVDRVVAEAFGGRPEADLVIALRTFDSSQPSWSFVAVTGEPERIVGHVMISRAHLVDGDHRWPVATLAPLAVAPDAQRQGVGKALVRHALAVVDSAGEPLVALEGDPGYYGRLGFVAAHRLGIEMDLPDWAPAEAAQVMTLAAHRPEMAGHLDLPEAFDAVE